MKIIVGVVRLELLPTYLNSADGDGSELTVANLKFFFAHFKLIIGKFCGENTKVQLSIGRSDYPFEDVKKLSTWNEGIHIFRRSKD